MFAKRQFVPQVERCEPIVSQTIIIPLVLHPPKSGPQVVVQTDQNDPTVRANAPVIVKIVTSPAVQDFIKTMTILLPL